MFYTMDKALTAYYVLLNIKQLCLQAKHADTRHERHVSSIFELKSLH